MQAESPLLTRKVTCITRFLTSALIVFTLCDVSFAEVDFDSQIKPLLSDRCFICHGPDNNQRQADLRLDTKDGAFGAAESGNAARIVAPGKTADSELFLRITSTDPDMVMPPPDSNLTLSKSEIALVQQWIEEGASWKKHWAFIPPAAVGVPRLSPFQMDGEQWPRNEIDAFAARRMALNGMKPSPRAKNEQLLRRLSFDLTGLPPTLAELDEWLADPSDAAWERAVDRLLNSERFGERMAADWLDVSRYSDTYGYQVDRDRYVWPWRDWVINAFNNNMPYDQFVTEQLAGDLIPNATDQQILATTFNRLHPQKVEGGSVPEEFRIEYVADRTQTFATAFLGLTLECARCHDHKYDPLSQREYYQFTAFFDKIDEAGLYSYFTPSVPTPTLLLKNDSQKKTLADLKQQIVAAEKQLDELRTTEKPVFEKWRKQKRFDKTSLDLPGQVAHLDFESKVGGGNKQVPGKTGSAVQLSGDDAVNLKVGNFPRHAPFSVSLWMNTPDIKQRAVVFHRSRAWTDAGSRGYQLLIEQGRLSFSLIHFWPGNAIRVKTRDVVTQGSWHHVVVTWDGSGRAQGVKLFLDGKLAATEIVRDNLYKNITGGGGDNIAIGQRFRDNGFSNGLVDEFRVFDRQISSFEVSVLHRNNPLARWNPSSKLLFEHYLLTESQSYQKQQKKLKSLREKFNKTNDGIKEIMVMQEMASGRQTHLLERGTYDAPADRVSAETPRVFTSITSKTTRNRLGLAQWLTDPKHPLTARVAVNRFWQAIFGQGLVRTPEDFGTQGRRPTHPDLLDWLARDFVDHKWDVKRLLKQFVMSATYRQSSAVNETSLERDPENLWLSRAASFRWPAEMLRDNALATSGLLINRIGGAPARPYEVEVSFKPTKRDKGDGLYRRSVYTFWKRTGPAPVMMTLDAAKRDVCRVKRERTSSPLAALVMLNGPQFVEAARLLAARSLTVHSQDATAALIEIFRRLTSRIPDAKELRVLSRLYDSQYQHFQENPADAASYLKTGDKKHNDKLPPQQLAALTVVANALLNFDECLTRR